MVGSTLGGIMLMSMEAREELSSTLETTAAIEEDAGNALPELAKPEPEDTPLETTARDDSSTEEAALLPAEAGDDTAEDIAALVLDPRVETSTEELTATGASGDVAEDIAALELDPGPTNEELTPTGTGDETAEDSATLVLDPGIDTSVEEPAPAREDGATAELEGAATEIIVGTEDDPTSTIELTNTGPLMAADACLELDAAFERDTDDDPTTIMELTITGPLVAADTGRELDTAITVDPDDIPAVELALGDALPPAKVVIPADDGRAATEEMPDVISAADEDKVVTLTPASNRAPL